MTSKGAITISQDELIRMKMRANLIPQGNTLLTQPTLITTKPPSNISSASNAQTSGPITPRISNGANRKNAIVNSKRKNSKGDALMKRRGNSRFVREKRNWLRRMKNCSRIPSRCEH